MTGGKRAVVVDGLSKSYSVPVRRGGVKAALRSVVRREMQTVSAISDVSFSVEPGEIVGILGPNGAGKTTLLKSLAGLLRPTSGYARVDGYEPSDRDAAFLRRMSIVTGMRSQLQWDIPVIDSLRLNRVIYGISQSDFDFRLRELADRLELGGLQNKPPRNLSLGERMKCELVAALLHAPRILFLDEPTLGLDLGLQRAVRSFIADFNDLTGSTILLTSHYMADVEALCDRVIIIESGGVLFDGALDQLGRRFAQHKTVVVEFADDTMPSSDLFHSVLDMTDFVVTGNRVAVEVPTDGAVGVTQELVGLGNVLDLTITDPPIETIIEAAFGVKTHSRPVDVGNAP